MLSSSLRDCSSSLEVSSSSLADWSSSFIDMTSSFDDLEFLVGTLQLLDGALQVIARGLQLLLELAQQVRLCLGDGFRARPAFQPADSAAPGTRSAADRRSVGTVEGLNLDVHPAAVVAAGASSRLDASVTVLADGPADAERSLASQARCAPAKAGPGWAGRLGLGEVVLRRPGEVQDLIIAVDHNAGQSKPAEQGSSASTPRI